jgi:hypothetical protein
VKESLQSCGRPAHRETETKSIAAARNRERMACQPY